MGESVFLLALLPGRAHGLQPDLLTTVVADYHLHAAWGIQALSAFLTIFIQPFLGEKCLDRPVVLDFGAIG